jgi:hypothetical protein
MANYRQKDMLREGYTDKKKFETSEAYQKEMLKEGYTDKEAFDAMNTVTASPADTLMSEPPSWKQKLSDRGIGRGEFRSLYKQRWGDLDQESYSQVENLYSPEYYERLEKENFPPEIIEASLKDAETYMDEMRSGIDLKASRANEFSKSRFGAANLGSLEKEKIGGLKGFFQRLLPGGKSGYAE